MNLLQYSLASLGLNSPMEQHVLCRKTKYNTRIIMMKFILLNYVGYEPKTRRVIFKPLSTVRPLTNPKCLSS